MSKSPRSITYEVGGSFSVKPTIYEGIIEKYRNRNADFPEIEAVAGLGDIEGISKTIRVDVEQGIEGSEEDLESRVQHFGNNKRPPPEIKGFCKLLVKAFEDFIIRVLMASGILSIVINMIFEEERQYAWIDGAGIFIAVIIVTGVAAYNDYKKEQQFIKLISYAESKKMVKCLRKGEWENINENDLVVGDIIRINNGMNIPADGLVIEGNGILCDESSMTGEAFELKKGNLQYCQRKMDDIKEGAGDHDLDELSLHEVPSPVLLSGTQIKQGDGKFLIIVVGDLSCLGKILKGVSTDIEASPLQEKLEAIARDIGKLGLLSAIVTVVAMLIRFFIMRIVDGGWDGSDVGTCFSFILVGLAVIVVAIPEGLPLAVTISLAYSVRKMLIDKNFVKRLMACEIMGGANNICSDKTGTLTNNQMKVTQIWSNNKSTKVDPDKKGQDLYPLFADNKLLQLFSEGVACNCNAVKNENNYIL